MFGGLCYVKGLKGRYVCTPFKVANEFETALARLCAYQNPPENQCVFIRGFRVTRSFWILPRRLEAAAGPSPELGGTTVIQKRMLYQYPRLQR